MHRRAGELFRRTRTDISSSVAAVLLFLVILQWRLAWTHQLVPFLGAAASLGWLAVSLVRFRTRLVLRPEYLTQSGVDHYRHELMQRRGHLRSAWIWYGPVTVAGLTMAAALAGHRFGDGRVLLRSAPFLALLGVWIGLGVRRRRAEIRQLNEEIAELDRTAG
ncbi:MAG: hypothetical protein R2729_14410 [Bryobacteraceae bacterium]